jgi:hypothetical protein
MGRKALKNGGISMIAMFSAKILISQLEMTMRMIGYTSSNLRNILVCPVVA